MEEKIRNLTFIVVLGFIITFILIIGLYFRGGTSSTSNNNNNNNSSGSSSSNSTYDVSKMDEVDTDEALALFEEEGTHVLYLGRSTCSICVSFVPVLNEVQEDLGFTTNYLDVTTIADIWDSDKKDDADVQALSDKVKELTDKMSVETTVRTTMDGETVTLEDTIGNLFYEYGFTPITVIIKDGEMVDGFVGYRDAETLTSLIEEHL